MNSIAFVIGLSLIALSCALPSIRVGRQADEETGTRTAAEESLGLPSNSTSIRESIVDTFDCNGRIYGYYADQDNGCQVFHVCMPIVYADGRQETSRWSFICPEQTVFDQAFLVCARPEDATPCEEAQTFYNVNEMFGVTTPRST
ncbi:unnamed protein product [Darwinula stevensoni]|uniref:Chitin-binding type-2 domain-containing protein n=1 Tax=Darwinula stevensoni TaxID=69355 RepID=A0A7R9A969_9CRUS|nr:unnamed protein product [Darwinula stevensoni]CAG0897086.1 unnamed protein product [Darwinula stevensoni]